MPLWRFSVFAAVSGGRSPGAGALTKVLNKKNGIQVLAVSAFSPQALQQITDQAPNVLLLDSAAFEFSDVQIIPAARRELPDLKVMLIGMEENKEILLRAVRAGVVGYVLKDAHASEIAAAVRYVAANNAVCPPRLCLALFESVARQPVPLPVFHSKRNSGFPAVNSNCWTGWAVDLPTKRLLTS